MTLPIRLTAGVEGGTELRQKLAAFTPRIREFLGRGMVRLLIRMQSHVKRRKLSGQVLHRRTGNLSRSIHYAMDPDQANVVSGRIFVGPNAPYGAVHEYGGTFTVREHLRMQTLHHETMGETERVPVLVRAYSVTYPERSFMRSTLRDFRDQFRQMVERAIREGTKPLTGPEAPEAA